LATEPAHSWLTDNSPSTGSGAGHVQEFDASRTCWIHREDSADPGSANTGRVSVIPCTPIGFGEPGVIREQVGTVEYRRLTSSEQPEWSRSESLERNALALFGVAIEEQPQMVHAASGYFGPDMGLVGLAVARAISVPFVYEMRGVLPETWAYDGEALKVHRQTSWLRWSQEIRVASEAQAVIVIGTHLGEELIRGGVDPDKIFLVPNGVDTDQFSPATKVASVRPRIPGLNPEYPTVGYISNLGAREGHLILVRAIDELRSRGVHVNCVLVGDGPMKDELEKAVGNHDLRDRVFIVGSVPHEEIVSYYGVLDVFVVPREDDRAARYTTPLKPYEAMAMGIPLVVSDLPALEEIIGGGERGVAFYCGSASSLADTIASVLEDPEGTDLRSSAALDWVSRTRKWDDNAVRYREAFDFALRNSGAEKQL